MKTPLLSLVTLLTVISSSSQSQNWEPRMNGIEKIFSAQYYPTCNESSKIAANTYLAVTSSGIYKTTDNGLNWTKKNNTGFNQNFITIGHANNNRKFAFGLTQTIRALKSDDMGETWDSSSVGLPGSLFIEDLIQIGGDTLMVAGRSNMGATGVYVSTNNGNSWSLKSNVYNNSNASLWSMLKLSSSVIIVGSGHGVYKSVDGGVSFSLKGISGKIVTALRKASSGKLYAATAGSGIYTSADNGETWTQSAMIGNGATIFDLNIDNDGNIYVCHYNVGIFKYDSNDNLLANFGSQSNGLENRRLRNLLIDDSVNPPQFIASVEGSSSSDGYLYFFGFAGGSTGLNSYRGDKTFTIYPNPASDAFYIQTSKEKDVDLLDISGRRITTFHFNEGTHQVNKQLAPGVYFIVDRTSGEAQKIILK